MDIAQAAHFSVDQVLAVARAKQAARHLDVAREDAGEILERLDAERRADQQRHRRGRVGLGPLVPMTVPAGVREPVPIAVAVGMPVTVTVTVGAGLVVAGDRFGRVEPERLGSRRTRRTVGQRLGRNREAAQAQPHFGRAAGLAGVAAGEDDVLHLVAAEALGALLAQHPGDGIGYVALAAAVGTDDGGHTLVESQLRAIGERFKP